MMTRRHFLVGGAAVAGLSGAAALGVRAQMGSMSAYREAEAALRAPLAAQPELADMIRYATLAASGHNTQPWRFRPGAEGVGILPDFNRRTPVVDPDNHHLYASLGCAAENLGLAAAARGRHAEEIVFDQQEGALRLSFVNAAPSESAVFSAIPKRQSTRADYDGRAVPTEQLRMLATAAQVPGVDLVLLTERAAIERIGELVVAGNSAQMTDPAFLAELKSWLRFSPRTALARGDGLFGPASGNPVAPEWLGPLLFDLMFQAKAENEKYVRQLRSSAGVAVFVGAQADAEHWIRAGRACQRFALQATALGLKHAFINQPVEVAALRPELATLVGLPGRRPDLVMRFGYGPTLPYAPRRPMAAVLG